MLPGSPDTSIPGSRVLAPHISRCSHTHYLILTSYTQHLHVLLLFSLMSANVLFYFENVIFNNKYLYIF